MTDDGKGREPEIERYGAEVIGVHWLFIIFLIPMLYTGLLMWRDWFTHEFHIYGIDYLFPSFEGMESIHVYTGLIVLAVGGAHLLAHWGQKEIKEVILNGGMEVSYVNLIAARLGYIYDQEGQVKALTVGFGLNLIDLLKVDLAYIPSQNDVALANTLRVSATLTP